MIDSDKQKIRPDLERKERDHFNFNLFRLMEFAALNPKKPDGLSKKIEQQVEKELKNIRNGVDKN